MDNHRAETWGEKKKKEGKEDAGGMARGNKGTQREPMGSEGGGNTGVTAPPQMLPFSVKDLNVQLLRRNKGARNKDSESPENHTEKLSHIQRSLIDKSTCPCSQVSPKTELSLPD